MLEIQTSMAQRAMELLLLEPGKSHLILDIGCGSGISGEELSDAGNMWIGVDISQSMLGRLVVVVFVVLFLSVVVCLLSVVFIV
jgi:18S rRNA (guanine1575-N7)-methyltransferase